MTLGALSFTEACALALAAAHTPDVSEADLRASIAATDGSFAASGASQSQARQALDDALVGSRPSHGLKILLATGALTTLIPPLARTVALSQESGRRHKDVWEHTLAVIDGVRPELSLRMSALLHDIGKPDTLRFSKEKGATFHNHPAVGANLAKAALREMRWDASRCDEVVWLVAHHLRPAEHSSAWSDSAVRRFVRECGDRAQLLIELSRADLTTRNPVKRARARDNADSLEAKMRRVIASDAAPRALVKGFGNWLA